MKPLSSGPSKSNKYTCGTRIGGTRSSTSALLSATRRSCAAPGTVSPPAPLPLAP
jgi:hypothetical protein